MALYFAIDLVDSHRTSFTAKDSFFRGPNSAAGEKGERGREGVIHSLRLANQVL